MGTDLFRVSQKTLAILKVLSMERNPIGSRVLARRLGDEGIDISERGVRYHLKLLDEQGLTHNCGSADGRSITRSGLEEMNHALVVDRIGLMLTRVNALAYRTSFKAETRTGMVPVDVSLIPTNQFCDAMVAMKRSFNAKVNLSELAAVASAGECLGEVMVPPGKTGLATVSQGIVYATLIRAGIPVDIKFGGIVQIQNRQPLRFTDLIEYSGCSLNPATLFISSRKTSITRVAGEGQGSVLAGFCEIPALALRRTKAIIGMLSTAGINSLIRIGKPGEPVCEIPVGMGKVGMVLTDGQNLAAIAAEAGIEIDNQAMSGVIDFQKLTSIYSLEHTVATAAANS